MDAIGIELVKGGFTLGAVVLGSWVALNFYFRQKEYELTKQRYLEGGLDILSAELNMAFGIVSHNYARSLELCRMFRDFEEYFQISELKHGFLLLDRSKFHEVAHYRVSALIGTNVVWEAYQAAMVYANSANSVIAQDIPEAIRISCQRDEVLNDRKSLTENMINELRKSHDEGFKYALLTRELCALEFLLEAERLNLKSIAGFRNRTDVKAIVARLQSGFNDEALNENAA